MINVPVRVVGDALKPAHLCPRAEVSGVGGAGLGSLHRRGI